MSNLLPLGVLASGEGTNLQALLDASARGAIGARVASVIANVPDAGALRRATRAGVPTACIPHRDFPTREAFEAAVMTELTRHGVELVVLAGFMRLLGPSFVRAWQGRLLNVHPSLLPAFPGVAAARQALDRGVRITGCTVHFVDEGVDSGPILAQAAVPVVPGESEEALLARVHAQEHRILPHAVGLIAAGRVRIEGRRVLIDGEPPPSPLALTSPELP